MSLFALNKGTLYTHSVFKKERHEGDVGLELEVEAHNRVPLVVPDPWEVKEDGSLRHTAREYVSRGVQKLDTNFLTSLIKLCELINDKENRIILDSPRTSVHVHINAGKFPFLTTVTAALAWWLYEDYIIQLCCNSRTRKGNHFCLPLSQASGMLDSLRYVFENGNTTALNNDNLKYGAQNLWSLTRIGSVEYRCLEGRYDPKYIYQYANMLYQLYVRVQHQFPDPAALMRAVDDRGLVSVFHSLFQLPEKINEPFSGQKLIEMSEGSLSFIYAFAELTEDWEKKCYPFRSRVSRSVPPAQPAPQLDVGRMTVIDDVIPQPLREANIVVDFEGAARQIARRRVRAVR